MPPTLTLSTAGKTRRKPRRREPDVAAASSLPLSATVVLGATMIRAWSVRRRAA
ncbi:MAG TPA: hypothetical protein VM029_08805 [Opitutaceae bacterium]|nr:hypothetical protein [Opitutaceae bacterium]